MVVAFDQVKDKLLTLEQVQARLSETEPLSQKQVSGGNKVTFAFDPTWAIGLDQKQGTESVDAVIRIDGTDHQLTKDAALQAGAAFGLPGKHAENLPSHLLEAELNHWFGPGFGEKEFNMLSTGRDQTVAAFTRPTINPFSNTLLVSEVVQGIVERYGTEDVYVDYKFNHSLTRTDVRFIIPEATRLIRDGGLGDVPAGADDVWSGGIHLSNSLIGKSQTKLETYLFRYWCTNGATTLLTNEHGQALGTWSRRGDHDDTDVYEWAASAVDEVLGGLEAQFDQVQALTQLNVAGNVGDIVAEIFDTYNVPVSQRKAVNQVLIEAENLTMYTIMNAITQTANEDGLSADRVDKILRIGGAIPGATFNTLKSQVWREGHLADPDAQNPYEIRTINS
jgi:hypothetical protein